MSVIGDFFTGIGVLGQAKEANEQNKLLAQQQYLDTIQQDKENQLANEQLDWNKKVAQMNYDLQKDQFNYQKELNDLQMQREDNAYSRAVQDLKNAGLSPLMLSSGASSAPLSSASAPQMDASGVNQAYSSKQDYYARVRQARQFYTQQKFMVHQQNRQMSLQTAQLALQVEKQHYENQLSAEQIKRARYENDWYAQHGYQHITLATVLSDFMNRDSTKKAMESIASMGDRFTSTMKDVVDSLQGKGDSVLYTSIPEFKNALSKQGLSKEMQKVLIEAAEAEAQAPLHKIILRDLDGILNRVYWKLAEKIHK